MTTGGTSALLLNELSFLGEVVVARVTDPESFSNWLKLVGVLLKSPAQESVLASVRQNAEGFIAAVREIDPAAFDEELDAILELAELATPLAGLVASLGTLYDDLELEQGSASLDGGEDLLHNLTADYLSARTPFAFRLLIFLGLIKETRSQDGGSWTQYRLRPDNFVKLLSAPGEVFKDAYRWGQPTLPDEQEFNYEALADQTIHLFRAVGLLARYEALPSTSNLSLDAEAVRLPFFEGIVPSAGFVALGARLLPATVSDDDPAINGFGLQFYSVGRLTNDFLLSPAVALRLGIEAEGNAALLVRPSGLDAEGEGSVAGTIGLRYKKPSTEENPDGKSILFGRPGKTRLELGAASFALLPGFEFDSNSIDPDFAVEIAVEDLGLVVPKTNGDGFIQKILPPEGLRAFASLTVGWSLSSGFYVRGSGGLKLQIPINQKLGPLELIALAIELKLTLDGQDDGNGLSLALGLTAAAEFGPLYATIEGVGLNLLIGFPEEAATKGPRLSFEFKPPTGVGLSLDVGPVSGGGFLSFHPDEHKYNGVLALAIGDIKVSAIALIVTKPVSILFIVNVEFSPGILVFSGIFITGFGGLVGIHRGMNSDALKAAVGSGAISLILRPEDPVKNAAKIIQTLEGVFPVQQGTFLFGVKAQFSFGSPAVVTADIALILQFPPLKIALLGSVAAALPPTGTEETILRLNMEIAGCIDFEGQFLWMEARLYDSEILGLELTGGMAMRARWGKRPAFLLAVGGFDPNYDPPADVGEIDRVGFRIGKSNPTIRMGGYFAVTGSTFQTGAEVVLSAKVGGLSIYGYTYFAAYFEFNPFLMRVRFELTVEVSFGSWDLLGVDLDVLLEGPGPWVASAHATIKIGPFKKSVDVEVEFGDKKRISLPKVEPWLDVLAEFNSNLNWTVSGIPARSVTEGTEAEDLAPNESPTDPAAPVDFVQGKMALGTVVEKVGSRDVPSKRRYEVRFLGVDPKQVSELTNNFGRGFFKKLSQKSLVSEPEFEDLQAGVRLTPILHEGNSLQMPLLFETEDEKPQMGQVMKAVLPGAGFPFALKSHIGIDAFVLCDLDAELGPTVLERFGLDRTAAEARHAELLSQQPELAGAVDLMTQSQFDQLQEAA